MLEDVLTFVDGSVRCEKAIDGAVAFCRGRHARLRLSLLNKSVPFVAAADAEGYGYALAANDELYDHDLSTLRARLGAADVATQVGGICNDAADLPACAAAEAGLADLVLIGPPSAWGDGTLRRRVAESLILDAAPPALIQADGDVPPALFSHLVLGWKASAQAARAARAVVALAERGARIDVLSVDEEVSSERPGGCDRVADYLTHHGFAVSVHARSPGGASVSEALQQFAIDREAQLLAVGGYAHSRLRERFFGGVTQDLLAASRVPVLMVG